MEKPTLAADTQPWLSVIMPTYNGEVYLEQALESLVLQNEPEMEVIVVDDGSTDKTNKIVASFAGRLNLRSFFREHTGSWVKQTNFGLAQAQGEYISILHQDDYWLKDRLAVIKPLTKRFPEAVLFLHPSWFVSENGRRVGKWTCPFPRTVKPLSPEFVRQRLVVQNFISVPAPLFKKEAALRTGAMDERLWFTADWKYWLSFAGQGNWIYHSKPLSCFRIHAMSQTFLGSANPTDFRRQHELVQREFLPLLQENAEKRDSIESLAVSSARINALLAYYVHGKPLPIGRLFLECIKLNPVQLVRLFYYARIFERVVSRIRAGFIQGR
jgi:glycosyltransferase involved in cell wall biosynthesis